MLPESLCDVTSWLIESLSDLSPPPAPPLPRVSDSCRLIFLILSMRGGRGGRGGRDSKGGGAASLETTPGQIDSLVLLSPSAGVKKGDRVSIYMPMVVELVVAMLACVRIGAVHSIVFAGFSAESLCERILDSQCSLLVTAGGFQIYNRSTLLVFVSRVSLCLCRGFPIQRCIMLKHLSKESGDAPLGSQSPPAKRPCTDLQCVCVCVCQFEGLPTYPDVSRMWEIVDKYHVTKFYTAPTAIRLLMKYGREPVQKYKRDSLKVLGTVGEPINPEAWHWYYSVVGEKRCPIVDTFWQTETGGHVLTPLPAATPMKPGSARLVASLAVLQVFKQPWPGVMRTVYGNQQRFETTYFKKFPGYYVTGDGCRRDKDGYYWITGRIDDMLNVSGHLLSTAEVESALAEHEAVAEAAVVGRPHPVKGESLYCFVTLTDGVSYSRTLEAELKKQAVK
ncbi:acetyl-coenzyme A synthetase, cytoplasmic-like [Etheostoma cragini]|uniref:acetyl-coenzyme A synthetase, cytoplasmic-like n=1 Tax=Etheostoma cragini TaxID=417921 RepID=UPI00155E23F0|nr:acetyl-coenzyme A synthetase, cytoplasmic-like [Etheostoma cragini]